VGLQFLEELLAVKRGIHRAVHYTRSPGTEVKSPARGKIAAMNQTLRPFVLGLVCLLAACRSPRSQDVGLYADKSGFLSATEFIAEGSWFTARHVDETAARVGSDVVRLRPADRHGFGFCWGPHAAGERADIFLAPWPEGRRTLAIILLEPLAGRDEVVARAATRVVSGFSGSPVVCSHGEVIGVVSAADRAEPLFFIFSRPWPRDRWPAGR
jgi:hypothetical protein